MKRELHSRFQVVVEKRDGDITLDVVVYKMTDRRGVHLHAETQCHDPFSHKVQFVIRDSQNFDQVRSKLERQLAHRGFVPLRWRLSKEDPVTGYSRWLDWEEIPDGYELVSRAIEEAVAQGRNQA